MATQFSTNQTFHYHCITMLSTDLKLSQCSISNFSTPNSTMPNPVNLQLVHILINDHLLNGRR